MLSIIIPTLQAAATLGATLQALAARPAASEIIVADGGSTDATRELAEKFACRMIAAGRGRGPQLQAGADAAGGNWLLFVHGDTVLAPGWGGEVAGFMADPANRARAAVFRFALDDGAPGARRLERLVAWRCRFFGLPYGDQGLLIGREFFDSLGGFRAIDLYEDVDIVRRIGRRRLRILATRAVTSAARYRRGGYVLRPMRNLTCLGLYFLGLPPRLIGRLYR